MSKKKVAIVGLGTGGSALSLVLARSNRFQVSIFESKEVKDLQAKGAGIGLQPVGLRVLERLDEELLDSVIRHGSKLESLRAVTKHGKDVLNLNYADFDPSLFGLGLSRSVLHEELVQRVLSDDRISLHCGSPVIGCRIGNTKAAYKLDPKGSYVKLEGGSHEGPFDLIIAADGRSSTLRRYLKPFGLQSFETWYDFGCVMTTLEDHDGKFLATQKNTLLQRLDGCNVMLGFMPTGFAHGKIEGHAPLVSMFWSLEMRKLGKLQEKGIDYFKELLTYHEPRAELLPLLDQITSFDDLIPAYYSNTFMSKLYFGESFAVIGDAAHATSPQLGQGANLALVDAFYLDRSLRETDCDIPAALRKFDRDRKWRLRFYQMNSVLITPVFQSNSRLVAALRDRLFGSLCKFHPTRTQMLATLTGAQKNGIPFTRIDKDEYVLKRKYF